MKKFKTLLTTACLALLFTTNTKAQDDANCGVLVDGVLAENIPSWAFGEMSVVIPKTPEWDKFDLITIYVEVNGQRRLEYYDFAQSDLNDFAGSEYIVCNIYTKNDDEAKRNDRMLYAVDYSCPTCKYDNNIKDIPIENREKPSIEITVRGHKITGITKGYDPNGNFIQESLYDDCAQCTRSSFSVRPNYGTLLYQSKKIPSAICYCMYDKKTYKEVNKKYNYAGNCEKKCDECKIDYSKPPVIPGKKFPFTIEKVDYAGKYGKVKKGASTSSNTKTEVKTNNTTTTTKTTVTKTTTTKTTGSNSSSSALTASALKPLDKNKAGYFVEKDDGVITQEGYKKGDARNGEVRVYDEGKLRSVITYVNDEKNGAGALYYSNGNLEESGNYKNDNKEGEWKRYTEAGKLAGTDVYVDGEKQ